MGTKKNGNGAGTDVAVTNTNDLALEKHGEIFGSVTPQEGIELRLSQIKIVHQNQAFELPDGQFVKEFKGIILDIVNVNAWWEESYDDSGGGTPPSCFSMDGVKPNLMSEQVQSETCASCEKNKFGSDGGRGKSCKNMKRIHIMFDKELFPKRLTVPPTSLESINVYGSSLTDKGIPYQGAVTVFGLKESANKDGVKYSKLNLRQDGYSAQTKEEFQAILKTRNEFMPAMREQAIEIGEITE